MDLSSTENCFNIFYVCVWAEFRIQSCLKTGQGWMSTSLMKNGIQKSLYTLDFHHLSSQTWTCPLAVLRWGAALDEQPAKGAAHLAFCQPSRIDTHAADHILKK